MFLPLHAPLMTDITYADLLISYGIATPQKLHEVTQIARTYCYALWNGKRKLGAELGRKISQKLSIPLDNLLDATPAPPANPSVVRRGRPNRSDAT